MKKTILLLLAACLFLAGCSGSIIDNTAGRQASDEMLDELFDSCISRPVLPSDEMFSGIFCTDYANTGLLRVRYTGETNAKLKLQVIAGESEISYNLKGNGSIRDFPLQFGSGEYTARILQNVKENEYIIAESTTFTVALKDDTCVYLNSVQNIHWNYGMAPMKNVKYIVANSLAGCRDDDLLYCCCRDIYRYIIANIKYDPDKVIDVIYDYLPDIEQTYADRKGICYDYASLFAAMLRSISIPAKLVKGYAAYNPGEYHAWNEVYIGGKWLTIDVTRDASLLASGDPFDMVKDSADYTKVYEY
jgi:hypothetical protein